MRRVPYTVIDLVPEPMRGHLEEQRELGNVDLALGIARDYLEADDVARADMLAFFTSNGPEKVASVLEDLDA